MSKSREAEFLPLDEIILEKQVPVYYPFFFFLKTSKKKDRNGIRRAIKLRPKIMP